MHHFLYPVQDSFISNKSSEKDRNYGIDEMLIIGVTHSYSKVLNTTRTYTFANEYVAGMAFEHYTGKLTGSFFGTAYACLGNIVGGINNFEVGYFSGNVSGSLVGNETGSFFAVTNFSGSLIGYSGSINSIIVDGNVSGSLKANCFSIFSGQLTSSIGNFTGYLTGTEVKAETWYSETDKQQLHRALIKFDLTAISNSIVSGDISNPKFYLKLKSINAVELPTSYKIYTFPVSQSWNQGDGYWSDGGSDDGVSWNWRNSYSSSAWYSPYTDTILTSSVNYLDDYNNAGHIFSRGGGTWYNIPCTQSFSYEVSDINTDVTSIVYAWLSKTIPNEGFILIYSGETVFTSSNASMYFFSKETNTIYSPKLDIAWDDSTWVTGSFGTGSIIINKYSPQISGSMVSGITIKGATISGSFSGNAYLDIDENGTVLENSIVDIVGRSENVTGISIGGNITGSSYTGSTSNYIYFTASFLNGNYIGNELIGEYSSSMVTGIITGSFNEQLLIGYGITGSVPNRNSSVVKAFQYSPYSGSIMGTSSGSFNTAYIIGSVTDGILKGANVFIPITGSYCHVTSSYSFTSSIDITGSAIQPINTERPFVVIIQNLKKEYAFGDFPKIGVYGREKFPLKTFGKAPQQPTYITPKYLPTTSYYSIKDNETEEVIVDFDDYTKLSCNDMGNYFYLDTTGLIQERYYRILIRVVGENGSEYTFDSNDIFKITR